MSCSEKCLTTKSYKFRNCAASDQYYDLYWIIGIVYISGFYDDRLRDFILSRRLDIVWTISYLRRSSEKRRLTIGWNLIPSLYWQFNGILYLIIPE
jgi:hypothetical protein